MCVIICCDKDSGHIKKDMLKDAERMNDDGMGIAWINKDKKVQWQKGLNKVSQVMKIIKREKIKFPYIIHCRIASVGDVCPELTHPFEISDNANQNLKGTSDKGVLFHNGTWTEFEDIMIKTLVKKNQRMYKGKNSDSRSMAFLAKMYGIEFLQLIKNQKIAVLTPNGIRRFGSFPQVDKHYCSNDWFDSSSVSQSYIYDGYDDSYRYPYTYGYKEQYKKQLQYCEYCDRDVDEDQYYYRDDMCNKCYLDQNNINMKDLEENKKLYKGLSKKSNKRTGKKKESTKKEKWEKDNEIRKDIAYTQQKIKELKKEQEDLLFGKRRGAKTPCDI